ncbi:MAG: hypothetical protein WCE54_05620 [Ignavibacteriaceae bacterium]
MSNLPEKVSKYLLKYASPDWNLEYNKTFRINNVVVIPAISEYLNIIKLLNSLLENDNKYFSSTLIIFVINNTAQSGNDIKKNNAESIDQIRDVIYRSPGTAFTKKIISSGINLGLINAAKKGYELPEKDAGAGLARKIGMDLALTVFDYQSPDKKIIISLDADCSVKNNYLSSIIDQFNKNKLSAAVIKMEHIVEEKKTEAAIICYEIYIRYYILGLKLADSNYAFHTVGSAMAFDYETYISAGGMNKRKAGEDFYFLEKIAKRTKIEKIYSTAVNPSSRISWRVPFGTGPRIKRFISHAQDEYFLYDPESFIILKKWLQEFKKPVVISSQEYLKTAENIHPDLYQFLVLNNFENSWDKILNNSKSLSQLEKQKLYWFDGFRTLKLIHYLRDNSFPLIDMFDALDYILSYFDFNPGIKRSSGITPQITEQNNYLNILRKLT